MWAIEFIAEFDPFVHKHFEKCNKEKINITHRSQTMYEELVGIMGKYMHQINNLDTKCYSSIVDSVADVTHVNHLIIVVRYCDNGELI